MINKRELKCAKCQSSMYLHPIELIPGLTFTRNGPPFLHEPYYFPTLPTFELTFNSLNITGKIEDDKLENLLTLREALNHLIYLIESHERFPRTRKPKPEITPCS